MRAWGAVLIEERPARCKRQTLELGVVAVRNWSFYEGPMLRKEGGAVVGVVVAVLGTYGRERALPVVGSRPHHGMKERIGQRERDTEVTV